MKAMLRSIFAFLICFHAPLSFACILSPEQEDAAFAKADADGNKRLSPEEYFNSYLHPIPNDMWDKVFASLDTNHDGVLTRNEYDAKAGNAFPTNDVAPPPAAIPKASTGCAGLK